MSKTFLIKVGWFLLCLVVLFAAVSFYDAWLRRDRTFYAQAQLLASAGDVSLVFLGDSHVMYALDTKQMPVDWYVYAYPGDNLRDSFAKLRHAHEAKKITAAVLSLDYHTLGTYRTANRNVCGTFATLSAASAQEIYGIRWYSYPVRWLECLVPLFQKGEREKFMVLVTANIQNLFRGQPEPAPEPTEAVSLPGNIEKQMEGNLAEPELVETLVSIVRYAEAEGITLIGIRLPLSNQYLTDLRRYDLTGHTTAVQNAGLQVLDFSEAFRGSQQLFKDISHLNEAGAAEFTPRIVSDVQALL